MTTGDSHNGSGSQRRPSHQILVDTHFPPVAATLLERNFVAEKPGRIRLADITCIPTGEGRPHRAVIRDPFARKAVGGAMREPMRAELAIAALTVAIRRRARSIIPIAPPVRRRRLPQAP